MPLPKRLFSLWVCFFTLGLSGLGYSQNKTKGDFQYQFFVDPRRDGKKIQVEQVLKKVGQSDCHIEFIFMNKGQEIEHQDKCSLFPLPLNDLTLCKAEVVDMGQVDTTEYITGVGVSGIQSRKK